MDAAGEITISVGIAHGPENAGNPRDLIDCAESAMMAAKARGKNRIVVYAGDIAERPDALYAARDIRSVAHLKMLQSVAARLNRLNSVKDIAEAIVSELRGLIDYHSCRVYLVEGDEVFPVAIKGDGVTEEEQVQALRIKIGTGVTGYVAETGRPVLAANALECDFAIQIPGTEKVDESVIAVPLRYGARVTGVVFLSKLGVGQFDESDLRLLEVLAGYAAVSLENARLYESLRLEADHAKAWLEFADAISGAESAEQIAEETAAGDRRTARLRGRVAVARGSAVRRLHVSRLLGLRGHAARRRSPSCESRGSPGRASWRRRPRPGASAPMSSSSSSAARTLPPPTRLPSRRCPRVTAFAAGCASASRGRQASRTSGCGSWRGSRTARRWRCRRRGLARHREQSLHVADALLDYARALARDKGDDVEERIVRLAAEMLEASEVSLWLQAEPGAEMRRRCRMGTMTNSAASSCSARASLPRLRSPSPGVPSRSCSTRSSTPEIPGAAELGRGGDVAVAPFTLDQGRMGFLVAGAPAGETFGELQLKMLAGLADQATLALAVSGAAARRPRRTGRGSGAGPLRARGTRGA